MTIYGGNFRESYQHNVPTETIGNVDKLKQLLPHSINSRGKFNDKIIQHLEWTKQHQYNNTFVHYQYHIVMFEGVKYFIHQQQYYNHNYSDYRSPGFTVLNVLENYGSENEIHLGTYIVETKAFLDDLKQLQVLDRVS